MGDHNGQPDRGYIEYLKKELLEDKVEKASKLLEELKVLKEKEKTLIQEERRIEDEFRKLGATIYLS